jgi:hypothetical protein
MPVGNTDPNLYFNRDTRVYLLQNSLIWELPVLNGYSFSQTTNTSEITLSEAADATGVSRRGRAMFNDSLAPAEWSFDTYVRPIIAGTAHAAIEEILWANFVANAVPSAGVDPAPETYLPAGTITRNTTVSMSVGFDNSNVLTLGTFDLVFVLGGNRQADANYEADGETTIYRVNNCSINEVGITFDLDGIATLSWSGMGSRVKEEVPAFDATTAIRRGIDSTNTFIRNKLTAIDLVRTDDGSNKAYSIVLTGGSITFSNNLNYLTPEVLGRVNTPLGHTTGARTVGGSFTAYLDNKTNGTMDLFEDMSNSTNKINNAFTLDIYVGGKAGTDLPVAPGIQFAFNNVQLEIPSHALDDVVGVEVNFTALPTSISAADEVDAIRYVGVTPV